MPINKIEMNIEFFLWKFLEKKEKYINIFECKLFIFGIGLSLFSEWVL
jgi:hypothetical protein